MATSIRIQNVFNATSVDVVETIIVNATGNYSTSSNSANVQGVTQSIDTSWTFINSGSVDNTHASWLFLKNNETASFNIDVAILSGSVTSSFATLLPQEFLTLPPFNGVTFIAKAQLSASNMTVCLAPK